MSFQYAILLILGIYGWTLPGADRGIEFYVKPNWNKLADVNVWFDAAIQIFFTMSTAYGGLITLASYNKFNRNSFRFEFESVFLFTFVKFIFSIFQQGHSYYHIKQFNDINICWFCYFLLYWLFILHNTATCARCCYIWSRIVICYISICCN